MSLKRIHSSFFCLIQTPRMNKSCVICIYNSKFIRSRACVTNKFVSLGVATSRKYVITLVMFGGLVAFSYCSHFVLITVVRIAPRPNAACLPMVSQMTLSVHLNIDGEFLRCLEHLLLVTKAKALAVQRQGRVYYTGSERGEDTGWEDAVGRLSISGTSCPRGFFENVAPVHFPCMCSLL